MLEATYELIMKYIVQEALIMIPVLLILGNMLKNTNKLDDEWIPVVLMFISCIMTPLILSGYSPQTIVQAILVGGAPVAFHQTFKQIEKRQEHKTIYPPDDDEDFMG